MKHQTIGVYTGRVTIDCIRDDKIEPFKEEMSKRPLEIVGWTVASIPYNQSRVTFIAKYGPVRGAWRSDVMQFTTRSLENVGSHARCDVDAMPGRRRIL